MSFYPGINGPCGGKARWKRAYKKVYSTIIRGVQLEEPRRSRYLKELLHKTRRDIAFDRKRIRNR